MADPTINLGFDAPTRAFTVTFTCDVPLADLLSSQKTLRDVVKANLIEKFDEALTALSTVP